LLGELKRHGKVIFKILINNEFDEDRKEIMSLIQFQGENFCKLYEYSLEDKVYIMERIVPADTLYEGACRDERIKIIGAIFKVLHKPNLPDSAFPTYSEWFEAGKEGTKNRNLTFIYKGDGTFTPEDYQKVARAEQIRNASDYDDFYLASKEETKAAGGECRLFRG